MNITDVESPKEVPHDILEAIFSKQLELTLKYLPIEEKNGLSFTNDVPVNLNCNKGQARLKAFAWYATEELVEAVEAIEDKIHYHEELIDALHFIVEFAILSGYKHKSIEFYYGKEYKVNHVYEIIHHLGMSCHKLKSKAWKQTYMLTDVNNFYDSIDNMFFSFFGLMKYEGLTPENVYDLYFRKSEVNSFRIRSKY